MTARRPLESRQTRLLSFSEISSAMTCQARHAFAYTGRMTSDGATLKPKALAPLLSGGRAWGAAVAAWHQQSGTLLASWHAHRALRESLDADAKEMAATGFAPSLDDRVELEAKLSAILDHYIATASPLPNLTRLEDEIVVGVPSRGGKNASSRYRFQCFLDGFCEIDGRPWIVEFKLRGSLTPPALLERQRQPRWYAWALMRQSGVAPAGVLVDERLSEPPKEPRLLRPKTKAWQKRLAELQQMGEMTRAEGEERDILSLTEGWLPSHAKDQLCTPEAYTDACFSHGVDPHRDVVDHLRGRQWQQRYPLLFRPSEMVAAGNELRDAAKLIRDLDSGALTPIRNANRANCGGCSFRDICSEPSDDAYVDSLFLRTEPKRLRPRKAK